MNTLQKLDYHLSNIFSFNQKNSTTNPLLTMWMNPGSKPPKDSIREVDLAKEGYNQTGTVYACIREISMAFACIDWRLFKIEAGEKVQIEAHPMLELWNRPNRQMGSDDFLIAVASYFSISGNSYIEAVTNGVGVPQYLYPLRPDRMTVIPDQLNRVGGYKYTVGGKSVQWIDGEILHFKDFHPTNDWYGLSPISVAAMSIDSYKCQQRWNKSLVDNSARPAGILSSVDDIDPEDLNTVKKKVQDMYQGPQNVGKTMVLEGGKFSWERMGLNAKELDFIKSQNLSALQIAQVFNVPGELIGLQPATYQNRREARKALYTEVVVPLARRFASAINNWLPQMYGEANFFFEPDISGIEALQEDIEKLWTRINESEELTLNEKRLAKGYDERGEMDVVMVSSSKIPLDDALDPFRNLPPTDNPDEDEDEEQAPKGDPFENVKETKQTPKRRKEILALGRLRKRFQRAMYKDIQGVFKSELARVLESLGRFGLDAENNIVEDIELSKNLWEKVFISNRLRIMKSFGDRSLNTFKKDNPDVEYKDAQAENFQRAIALASRLHLADQITGISESSKKRIRRTIEKALAEGKGVDEIRRGIEKQYKSFSKTRANTIALTEVVTAQNRGSLEAMNSLKISLLKEWIWSGITGEHERRGHHDADGQTVQQDKFFIISPDGDSGFEALYHPGDPQASAKNRVNCHCGLTYKRDTANEQR